jgi:hypothetical protein
MCGSSVNLTWKPWFLMLNTNNLYLLLHQSMSY